MMLTSEQQAYFKIFGFIAQRAFFSAGRMAMIACEFYRAMIEDRDDKPWGKRLSSDQNQ